MDYPTHEFSKYIDNQFSFQGDIKSNAVNNKSSDENIVDTLKHAKCDGDIMLEPRLIEYLNKKEYYKNHPKIQSCINPEREFSITKHDLYKIKNMLRGKRDIYDYKNSELNKNYIKPKQYFPSNEFRDDKRVQKISPEIPKKIMNRGMFVPDEGTSYYEGPTRDVDLIMDSRDFMSSTESKINTSSFNMNESRFDPRVDDRIPRGNLDSNAINSQYNVSGQIDDRRYSSQTHDHSKEQYNNLITRDMISGPTEMGTGKSSGPLAFDFFKTTSQPTMNQFSEMSDMDTSNRIVIPKVSSNPNKGMNTSDYMAVPYMGGGSDDKNTDLETDMLRGMPTRTQKSYGFRNQEEHHYNYIDPEFQSHQNTVMSFPRGGEQTRGENRQNVRKTYTRDIV